MAILIDLGKNLEKRARRTGEERISYRQVYAATGISPRTLSSYVTGRASGIQFDKLETLCDYLGCTPGELLKIE